METERRFVQTGVWAGRRIRRARKPGQCRYWMGRQGRCPNMIRVGDEYFEGDADYGIAGGFALERYCMAHAEGA